MTTLTRRGWSVRPATAALGSPKAAATWLAVREVRRSTLVVAALVGAMSALVAFQYRSTFSRALDTASLQTLAESPAIRTLFGAPVGLDDPGGFTVWRTGTFAAVLVGVWALLAATRITRGEEDSGRWELLLSGRLRVSSAVGRHLAVLVLAQLVVAASVTSALLLAGTRTTGSLLYGAAVGLVGVVFTGAGALAAQLVADRRSAGGLAVAALFAGLLLRMVADGASAVGWLRWATPFGLLELCQPYAGDRAAPLAVLAGAGAGLCATATLVARRRDLGAGLVSVDDLRPARVRLLRSLPRFAVRRCLRNLLGWAAGLGAYFLLIGLLAVSVSEFLTDNPRFTELATEAGFTELGTVEGYVASLFTLLSIPVGVYAASRVAADAADEGERRFATLFALPVSRLRWARTEAAVLMLGCASLATTAGVAAWAGTQLVGADLGLGAALAGVLNVLPVAALCLGAALFALGWAPRAVLPLGALPAVGGYLLLVLAESFGWPDWVSRLSPYAHVANVPAAPPDWSGGLGIVSVALLLAVAGAAGYARRDLLG